MVLDNWIYRAAYGRLTESDAAWDSLGAVIAARDGFRRPAGRNTVTGGQRPQAWASPRNDENRLSSSTKSVTGPNLKAGAARPLIVAESVG